MKNDYLMGFFYVTFFLTARAHFKIVLLRIGVTPRHSSQLVTPNDPFWKGFEALDKFKAEEEEYLHLVSLWKGKKSKQKLNEQLEKRVLAKTISTARDKKTQAWT